MSQQVITLCGLFENLFRDSKDHILRLSVYYPVKSQTLVTDSFNVLWDIPFFSDLRTAYDSENDSSTLKSQEELIMEDFHYYFSFLNFADQAGFVLNPAVDARYIPSERFNYDVYNIKSLAPESIDRFVNHIFDDLINHADVGGFLVFCSYHLEVYFV